MRSLPVIRAITIAVALVAAVLLAAIPPTLPTANWSGTLTCRALLSLPTSSMDGLDAEQSAAIDRGLDAINPDEPAEVRRAARTDAMTGVLSQCLEQRQARMTWLGFVGFATLVVLLLVRPAERRRARETDAPREHPTRTEPDAVPATEVPSKPSATPAAKPAARPGSGLTPSKLVATTTGAIPVVVVKPRPGEVASEFAEDLGLAQAAILAQHGVHTWAQLSERTRSELSEHPGIDDETLETLDAGLASRSLAWRG